MSIEQLAATLRSWAGDRDAVFWTEVVSLLALACALAFFVSKRVIVRGIELVAKRTKTTWDDILVQRGVFDRLAWVAPAIILYFAAYPFAREPQNIFQRLLIGYMTIVVVRTGFATLDAIDDIYKKSDADKARRLPIKGYLQIGKLLLFLVALVVVLASLLGSSPWALLTGIGAASAILLLIFRDTIMSFVASIQIATHDMIRIGDWITIPQFDADGEVTDIALHVVRIQNWDKTITTVPTYKFMEQAFKNWRGMIEAGARRIKRSIFIDQSSIRFLDENEIAHLRRIDLLKEYLDQKQTELAEYNKTRDGSSPANVRKLTNVGTFRAYAERYVRSHPLVHQGMSLIVRQLQPTPQGLPLEVYVFTQDTRWQLYEGVQSDLFDHLLAVLHEFGLRVFQEPSGHDMRAA